jgi:invasion protein IalB
MIKISRIRYMINKPVFFTLFVSILSFFSVSSSTAELNIFDDWALNCQQSCYIYQGMQSKDQKTIYSIQVSKISSSKMAIQLNFPLGLYIPTGVGIAVGDFKKNVPLTTCLPQGCHALLIVNDEIKKQLDVSDKLNVRFFTAQNKEKEINYSLKGFQNAFKIMSQR